MVSASIRLFKKGYGIVGFQTQMTAAVPIDETDAMYNWWLPGLNIAAVPYLMEIKRALHSELGADAGNPKSVFLDRMLKTPMKTLLGTPHSQDDLAKSGWVEMMLTELGLSGKAGDVHVAQALVTATVKRNKPQFELVPTEFSWRKYLTELLEGKDLLTDWAKHAFANGNPREDIGLGQREDVSIGAGYVIVEQRSWSSIAKPGKPKYKMAQMHAPDYLSYVDFARQWAIERDADPVSNPHALRLSANQRIIHEDDDRKENLLTQTFSEHGEGIGPAYDDLENANRATELKMATPP